jgi:hypothetical protein
MLRCVNRLGTTVRGRWTLGRPILEAVRTRLDETLLGALRVEGNTVAFDAAAHEIVTVLLR